MPVPDRAPGGGVRELAVTRFACLVLAAVPVCLAAAVALDWVAPAVVGLTAGAALVVSLPSTRLPPLDLQVRLSPSGVTRGQDVEVGVELRARGRRSPSLTVEIAVGGTVVAVPVQPGRRGAVHAARNVTMNKRGVDVISRATVVRRDAFGLVARRRETPVAAFVVVHPVVTARHVGSSLAGRSGGVLDLVLAGDVTATGIREFAPGDNPRHIDWRATARSTRIMTRTFEDPLADDAAVLLDTSRSSYRDDGEFEDAVDLAASLCDALLASDFRLTLIAGSLPVLDVAPGPVARTRMLDLLAGVTASADAPFERALEAYELRVPAYVVTGTAPASRVRADAAARRWPGVRVTAPAPAATVP